MSSRTLSVSYVFDRTEIEAWKGDRARDPPPLRKHSKSHPRQNGIPSSTIPSSSAPAASFLEERFDLCFLSDLEEVDFDSSSSSISSSARPLSSVFSKSRSWVSERCPRNWMSLALTSALVRGLPSRSVYCSRRNRPST